MWSDLFGPGWIWGVLSALGLFVFYVWLVVLADRRVPDNAPDTVQVLWHRYEQGDLTRWEFERLRRAEATCAALAGDVRLPGETARVIRERPAAQSRHAHPNTARP